MLLPLLYNYRCCYCSRFCRSFAYSYFVSCACTNSDIVDEWFGRTVIRSCSKLPYDVAQQAIEGRLQTAWSDTGADKMFQHLGPTNGVKVSEIVQDIVNFWNIAKVLRKKRFDGGKQDSDNNNTNHTVTCS